MPHGPASSRKLAIAATLLAFAGCWLFFRGDWLDDAFITFRYARNLADGLGPVFNPGEAVEGYTSFLWMLLCAVPFALLSDTAALRAIEATSFALACGVVWGSLRFPGPDGARRLRPTAAVLALAPVFLANSVDGMETPLLMALLLASAWAMLRPPSLGAGALAGALTAAVALTRPEALPLLLAWPAWALLLQPTGRAAWAGGFAATALPPVLAQLAFRLSFYGHPFPNTFYAKATGALAPRLEAGFGHLGALLQDGASGGMPPVWLWLGVGGALLGLRMLWRDPRPATRLWLAVLWTCVGFRVAFDVWSGGESMGTFRFLAAALPALFVLADEGLRDLLRGVFPGFPRAGRRAGTLAVATVVLLGTASAGHASWLHFTSRRPYREGLQRAHVALGTWLAASQPPGRWLAVGDAGAIPFYSRLPVIDLWGLNDATIAHLPGEYGRRPGVADYVLGRRPGLVVLWNLTPIHDGSVLRVRGAWPFDREIAEHPVFRRDYRFVREFVFREARNGAPNGYYLDVFERRAADAGS